MAFQDIMYFLICNQQVGGSIPSSGTKSCKCLPGPPRGTAGYRETVGRTMNRDDLDVIFSAATLGGLLALPEIVWWFRMM